MKTARITAVYGDVVGIVADEMVGSFVEHMGSCVYNGIYEPDHATADTNGFRGDVLALVKALKLSVLRYPGGNYSSGYRWRDTVGPVAERPARLDLAWRTVEPNTFGLSEFFNWAGRAGAHTIMTLNLGTATLQDACDLVEYANFPSGTALSDLRIAHGRKAPYDIQTWCLGNELDGPWQIGHKDAREYGRLAAETARAIRKIDPDLQLVAVGSSHEQLPTYPEWNREVLMHLYEDVEYLSMHKYIGKPGQTTAEYLAAPLEMDLQINETVAVMDYVKACLRSKRTLHIAFDEYMPSNSDWKGEPEPWQTGAVRDMAIYSLEDALVLGGMLLSLLRHCDRVKIACQAILVNVIPLILAEKGGPAWANATYYPMLDVSLFGRGQVLHSLLHSPDMEAGRFGRVPALDHVCVWHGDTRELTVFAVNRSGEPLALELRTYDFGSKLYPFMHTALTGALTDKNPINARQTVVPRELPITNAGDTAFILPPYSWNTLRLRAEDEPACPTEGFSH
jgi:alpha-L-arabinofuranosidase